MSRATKAFQSGWLTVRVMRPTSRIWLGPSVITRQILASQLSRSSVLRVAEKVR